MSSIKRVSLLATVALAALALTAASASAEIVDPSSGDPYVGDVAGVNTGAAPTLVTSTATITCQGASTIGTMDGGAGTGELDFAWNTCTTSGGTVNCSVNNITGVDVRSDEGPAAPDFQIINTELGQTFISCALVFNCTASSNPANGSEVEADVDGGADPVVTIADTVNVSGAGCPSTGQWNAQYLVTVPTNGLESNN